MIEQFKNLLLSYFEEYQNFSEEDIILSEEKSTLEFTPRTILINERIKISDTFTHYIIEVCKPSEVTPLRKLVEEYEKKVAIIKNGDLLDEAYYDVRDVTVVLDILFGIDVTYSSNLYKMIQDEKTEKIIEYFEKNINNDLSYEDLLNVIKGFGKKL